MLALAVRFILLSLLTLSLCRLALAGWQWPRVGNLDNLLAILLGGPRIDLVAVTALSLPVLLLAPWLGHRKFATRLSALWLGGAWLLLLFMELATPQFVMEYDRRPDRLFFEYLDSPVEIASMLWQGYKPLLLAVTLVMFLAVGFAIKVFPANSGKRFLWWQAAALTLLILPLGALAIRGTLQHRPINPSVVAFSGDNLINNLALNSLYSTAYAGYSMTHESNLGLTYGKMADDEVIGSVRAAAGLDAAIDDPQRPTWHAQVATASPPAPLNLVIIVEESLGAQYVGALQGQGLTPELDKLAESGWWFENLYATGTRSATGLEALSTGFLPSPARAVLKLPKAQSGFFTIAQLLRQQGYDTRFIYGGESHFDNMKSFFLGNGFDNVHDRTQFQSPAFVGSWGASDEDMFNELDRLLQQPGKPNFTLAFSVTNHTPWDYPDGRITPVGEPRSVENSVRYVDWALGDFFRKARQRDYWNNTVFLIVADHDARITGAEAIPLERFHIPALILGASIEAKKDPRLASQIDLPPTLLSLLGINASHPMLGHDLVTQSPGRALMQYGNTFGYLDDRRLLVLRPYKPATQYQVVADGHSLSAEEVDPALQQRALAHALFPTLAYENGWYASDTPDRAIVAVRRQSTIAALTYPASAANANRRDRVQR